MMKPAHKIKLTGLMATKEARQVFDALSDGVREQAVLFVGGCVRNALLGEAVSDIDLATKWTPQETTARLKKAGIKVIPTGIAHGTVTAVAAGQPFQITTLRQDVEPDGRHAKVAYSDDWTADAQRRDFTVNTLLADIRGNIYDPLGVGLKDLERRKIVFVGDPMERIREDYLRILRFFRFEAYYGRGKPDAQGLAACGALAKGIKTLSKERVTQELLKILSSPEPGKIIRLIADHNILAGIASPKFEELYFNRLKNLKEIDMQAMGLLILAGFSKSGTQRIEKMLRLTNKQQKQIDETLFYLKKFKSISDQDLKLLLYRAGAEIAELTLISRLLLSGGTVTEFKKFLSVLRKMERPVLPLRGQDLIDRGMKPGPDIKKALEKFERSWIRNL